MSFEKTIRFTSVFDERDLDSGKKDGVKIVFLLKGPDGAVHYMMHAGWYINDNQSPRALDLGHHFPEPQHAGHEITNDCLCGRNPCYYYGSSCTAKPILRALLNEGGKGVWKILEEEYNESH